MKFALLSLALALSARAQMPATIYGVGASWQRGATTPFQGNFVFAKNISAKDSSGKSVPSNLYLWTQAATPIAKSSTPLVTSLSAGLAYVAATRGRLSFVVYALGGGTVTQASSGLSYSGNAGVHIRINDSFSVMPYVAGSNLTGTTGTFIAQPGILFILR